MHNMTIEVRRDNFIFNDLCGDFEDEVSSGGDSKDSDEIHTIFPDYALDDEEVQDVQ